MAFKGTNYENKDIRKLAEDIINNGLLDPSGTSSATLLLQIADYCDTLTTFTGLIRDYTQPVVNSQVGTEMIVATGTLADLNTAYSAWIAANPSAVIISAVPINLSSERGLLVTYYE